MRLYDYLPTINNLQSSTFFFYYDCAEVFLLTGKKKHALPIFTNKKGTD